MTEQRKVAWYGISDPVPGPVSEYIGEPAKPTDSLKYACMTVGFSHRPIPVGSTKRKAFCSVCQADQCVYYPEMAPKQVFKLKQMPTKYPARAWPARYPR